MTAASAGRATKTNKSAKWERPTGMGSMFLVIPKILVNKYLEILLKLEKSLIAQLRSQSQPQSTPRGRFEEPGAEGVRDDRTVIASG